MMAKSIRYEQSGLQDWQKMLAESYTHPAELLADLDIPPDAREFNPAAFRL